MRFTAALVAGTFAVAASAQTQSQSGAASATVSLDPVQSSIYACIDDCDATDIGCLARCNPVSNKTLISLLCQGLLLTLM